MAVAVSFDLTGIKPLLRSLQSMPEIVRTRVLMPAAARAGKTLERSIANLIPVQKFSGRFGRKKKGKSHYRNVMTNVVREYKSNGSVVVVVGAESGTAPHAILVEKGTVQRFTNSKTKYQRVAVRAKTIIKNGKAKVVVEKSKQSVGSFGKKNKLPRLNRGRMPAFRPIQRGVDAAKATVASQLASDISRNITAELTAAKLSRGI